MKIIGFNLEKTHFGLPLDNGGACLIVDGEVKMMINEERLNRKQYSSGFRKSIEYLLRNNQLQTSEIDLFVASSCLEPVQSPEYVKDALMSFGFDVPLEKIKVCDHHLSHALTAYCPSGFSEAVVMVLDGDGNVLGDEMQPGTDTSSGYWKNKAEHNSYYVGRGNTVELVERDDVAIGQNGFGGMYRYFTYFCGFHGYRFAGKLMGLSAYGSVRNRYKDVRIFELLENGVVKCLLPDGDRLNSPRVVEAWLKGVGVNVPARNPAEEITQDIEDIAFLVQRELDRALVHKVAYLVKKTGIKNLCIAGGVGLNAVSNRAILDNTPIERIFIQPIAGDNGQCLGNAYFGMLEFDTKNIQRLPVSIYQGAEYSDRDILAALEQVEGKIVFEKMEFPVLAKKAAEEIAQNSIIAWFQGRSEVGARALGNRSILANPANPNMKDVINHRVKHRESFRPFAPSVLEDKSSEWFGVSIAAPYMIINAPVKHPEKIPAVTHKDGSARIQTVNRLQNDRYYTLISEFEKITGVPIVLNTSFNDNEAIVETPEDALNTFLRTNIDCLFIGDYRVKKNNKNVL